MLTLRTLGGVSLERVARGSIDGPANRPRCLALLAYLSANPQGEVLARDSLQAMFWPDSDATRARNSLRQHLYLLRHYLDDEVIVTRGRTLVGVNRSRLECDADLFDRALRRGRLERALELYAGDFLDGFHLSGAPEFLRWVDGMQATLRRRAVEAALTLGKRSMLRGSHREALWWLDTAHALSPYDETIMRVLLRCLTEQGEVARARLRYERFRRRRCTELGIPPDSGLDLLDGLPGPRADRSFQRRDIRPARPTRDGARDRPSPKQRRQR